MSDTAIREIVIRALAEEGGWLDEWGRQRDIEKAKKPPHQRSGWRQNTVARYRVADATFEGRLERYLLSL